jgi:hypothetical protein
MFFRRDKPHDPSFGERLAKLKTLGFEIRPKGGGYVRVTRNGLAAEITDVPGQRPHVAKAGLAIGDEVGLLTHGGYQMFFVTPSKKRRPALAEQLTALHEFEEDLKEGLGLVSLYNDGLGTTCELHMYDRLEHRDHPVVK